MTGRARAADRRQMQHIVKTRHISYGNRPGVEDPLAPGYGPPVPLGRRRELQPACKQVQCRCIKVRSLGIPAEWIVNSDEELLRTQRSGPTLRSFRVRHAGAGIDDLGGMQPHFEVDDLLLK